MKQARKMQSFGSYYKDQHFYQKGLHIMTDQLQD